MKKNFEKPEIKVINFEATDIITDSTMVDATVTGVANYGTQSRGMIGGTIGGTVFNNDWISDSFTEQ